MENTDISDVQTPRIPRWRTAQILCASQDMEGKQYLAFPSVIRTGDREILISFKRGHSHAADLEADLEMLRFDPVDSRVIEQRTLGHIDGLIMQMGEWIRFPPCHDF